MHTQQFTISHILCTGSQSLNNVTKAKFDFESLMFSSLSTEMLKSNVFKTVKTSILGELLIDTLLY